MAEWSPTRWSYPAAAAMKSCASLAKRLTNGLTPIGSCATNANKRLTSPKNLLYCFCYERYRKKKRSKEGMGINSPNRPPRLGIIQARNLERPKAQPHLANGWYGGQGKASQGMGRAFGQVQWRTKKSWNWLLVLDFTEKSVILLTVMRKTTKNIKWFINDLGLNELDAWLAIIGGATLTAAILTLLSGNGPEIFRFWRVAFLNLLWLQKVN